MIYLSDHKKRRAGPKAELAVLRFAAVSFSVPSLEAASSKTAYGRPDENSIMVLVQFERRSLPSLESNCFPTNGWQTAAMVSRWRWSSREGSWVLLKSN